MKFYIAKCKIPQMPAPDTAFSMMEYQLLTKQLLIQSGTQNFDFMLPPSTQKIIVFIQDAAAGTISSVNATRFKVRQFSDAVAITNRYGNYSNTWDEFLQAIQVTFSGITKPQSMFQPLEEVKYNTNYMLQRWIHTNQMNRNPSPEEFEEWLSMGPYYAWDFSRAMMLYPMEHMQMCVCHIPLRLLPHIMQLLEMSQMSIYLLWQSTGGMWRFNMIRGVLCLCDLK